MIEPILTVTARQPAEGVTVLSAAGEIDHDSRQILADATERALRQGGNRLVIDLTKVAFCDSGGLSLFVSLHKQTTAVNGQLRLACAQPAVLAVLHATNLDRLLALHPTVEEAVQASLSTP
jgi:anti-anti-sigma factor